MLVFSIICNARTFVASRAASVQELAVREASTIRLLSCIERSFERIAITKIAGKQRDTDGIDSASQRNVAAEQKKLLTALHRHIQRTYKGAIADERYANILLRIPTIRKVAAKKNESLQMIDMLNLFALNSLVKETALGIRTSTSTTPTLGSTINGEYPSDPTKFRRRKVDKQAWLWTGDLMAKIRANKSLCHVFLLEKTAGNGRKHEEAKKAARKVVAIAKATDYGDVKLDSRDGESPSADRGYRVLHR
ncbi:unnamed protein product [Heligmosomoides polygyrus]|uniref:NR LBD domain-containing protein n=1 Tax=Heligmosomoides polygyrus TaxID=6339 RepID=A0A183F2Q2_HELPZ|nr:unnamed protein product [Heligmosomoides polygyrus]